jgi:phosphatidylglycerophosphate synthase
MEQDPQRKASFYVINGITLYRLLATSLLLYFAYAHELEWFKWLLALSFFTDSIDGFLARKFRVVSVLGSRLDSVADDLTVLASMVGLLVFRYEFLVEYRTIFLLLLGLYIIQVTCALIRYRKFTSFHTWSAKFSFLLQGLFFILVFFLPQPPLLLFYAAAAATVIVLVEETTLVFLLPQWQADVKGLYWVLKKRRENAGGRSGQLP